MQQKSMTIQMTDVKKSFNHIDVLKQINLTINKGEFVVIVGKSGCGKSTLLRILAGLETYEAGSVTLDERNIKGLNGKSRMMFQDARLLPWLTVEENVAIGIKKDHNWKEKTDWALEQVGLFSRKNEWPSVLSGGQQQRVSLARALATNPSLLFLDEPLGALDALTRYEMQALIESVWEREQFTTVLVTHDVTEAVLLADRVILIEEGFISTELPIDLARPRNPAHPEFIKLQNKLLNQLVGQPEKNIDKAFTKEVI